jgi:methylated-DNA-[protein]-cysteine S-methyltransferase
MQARREMNSPIGKITLVASEQGLQEILFQGCQSSGATKSKILDLAERELGDYFLGKLKKFTVALDPQGTEFQKKTWSELRQIRHGETISYGEQAKRMGKPRAVRAVGAANGKNPLPIIVPCHRVVAGNRKLHGYAGGLAIKQRLLEIEGVRVKALRLA